MAKRSAPKTRARSSPPPRAAAPPGRRATIVVLLAFALTFILLEVASYSQKSAAWDEPIHVADGYASLVQHDYRIDPEHPPFLRMWAALPMATMGAANFDVADIERTPPGTWAWTLYGFCEKFLYIQNDADRLLYAGRFMIVLLGAALGALLFFWAREWLGFWPAVAALAFYTIEPNIAAHAALVTTDFGFACFMFGALYFLWRTCREWRPLNIAGLTVCFALAIISKYSALILGPIVALLIGVAVVRRSVTAGKAAGLIALLALASWVAVWAIYGFRYLPSASQAWAYDLQSDTQVQREVPKLASVVTWIDRHHLVPNVFSQGFLFGQAKAQVRPAFLNGEINDRGWWYYFPVAFAIKTPIAMLALIAGGLVLVARRWRQLGPQDVLFVLLPIAVYLAAAMATRLNIGLRHLLPIYPLLLMLVAAAAKALLDRGRAGVIALAAALAIGVVEFGRNYPDNLAFFNAFVGGPAHGSEYLVDSNLDWGQDLKPLKAWMDDNHVPHINLAYFGTAYPPYYGINATYLPGSAFFEPGGNVQLPGYVAVSATVLRGVYLGEPERAFYRSFASRTPVANIGHSIFVYWVEQPWW